MKKIGIGRKKSSFPCYNFPMRKDPVVRPVTAACLFAGMGGFCVALKKAGIRTLWANEVDSCAVATFEENHPKVRMIPRSVTDLFVKKDKLEPVDILTAGFPCQSFSQAGARSGFDDEQGRGKLFFEIPRLLKEFGPRRPKILLLENVPHLMWGGRGAWFETVLNEIRLAGYWFGRANCKILNAADTGKTPQNRERLFMVAMSSAAFGCNSFIFPNGAAKAPPISEFISRARKAPGDHYLPPDNRYCKQISRELANGASTNICQLRRSYARASRPGECPTLTANMGGGGHNVPFIQDRWGIRRLTVGECLALQGFKNYRFPSSVSETERYKQIGNAVTPAVARRIVVECARVLKQNHKTGNSASHG